MTAILGRPTPVGVFLCHKECSIIFFADSSSTTKAFEEVFQRETRSVFSWESLLILVLMLLAAGLIGRIMASALRYVVTKIGGQADKAVNLQTVNRLRRYETMVVLSIALMRTALFILALYLWWKTIHPDGRPTALIGASALAVIFVSSAVGPLLRDVAAGSLMMAEQWYGVGDHVKLEPFGDMQGVVERVTLRSTRIRGLNGEVIWVNNQNIQAVRIAPRGIRSLALELFVTNVAAGERLIEQTNKRLPIGPLLVITPLRIISEDQTGESLWHITAIAETAPGREWLIENSAVALMKDLDEANKSSVIAHGPLARFADIDAERKFNRSIHNARKRPKPKRQSVATANAKRKARKNSSV
ncbi:MAG: mechanosensitive ion channel MscS, small conductance mechanosensitive channel [Candidatus Saccharibacteria bacterium]|nr:mechanosensitive ion channel MscS, small conductance mechanosensitive channel [Candidatus Saccharibacteria bacterium]